MLTNPAWPGHVKVGHARDLKNRIRAFQTASPYRDYQVVATLRVPDRTRFERAFHAALRGHRVGATEWFSIAPQDARNILNTLKKELV